MSTQTEEASLPQFPALARCIVIDASHGSRISLVSNIKKCFLFEQIMEATSVSDAGKKICSINFDACILGPRISPSMANEFIVTYKPQALAKDCAFIQVVNEGTEDTNVSPDAHGIVVIPCKRSVMFEGMAKAILIASKGVGWPGVKLSEDGGILLLENGKWKAFSDCEPLMDQHRLPQEFVLRGDRESIERFCEAIPHTPKDRIEKVIHNLLADSSSTEENPFIPFFLASIKEWQVDITFMSLKEASQALKARLLSFSG